MVYVWDARSSAGSWVLMSTTNLDSVIRKEWRHISLWDHWCGIILCRDCYLETLFHSWISFFVSRVHNYACKCLTRTSIFWVTIPLVYLSLLGLPFTFMATDYSQCFDDLCIIVSLPPFPPASLTGVWKEKQTESRYSGQWWELDWEACYKFLLNFFGWGAFSGPLVGRWWPTFSLASLLVDSLLLVQSQFLLWF